MLREMRKMRGSVDPRRNFGRALFFLALPARSLLLFENLARPFGRTKVAFTSFFSLSSLRLRLLLLFAHLLLYASLTEKEFKIGSFHSHN